MRTSDFDYDLPPELIAQEPAAERGASRLMVLRRSGGGRESSWFRCLPEYLRRGDVLVLNRSRVIPARLYGRRSGGTGRVEVLLLEPAATGGWWVMLRPGKRVRVGAEVVFEGTAPGLQGWVREKNGEGHARLEFGADPLAYAERHGEMPLPPYIERAQARPEDRERYQTVFAREAGSVAAPTAGLHFTNELLGRLGDLGVEVVEVTLHVGVGTFAPVKAERVEDHVMHAERYEVGEASAATVNRALEEGRRVVAVGTTSLRVLEAVARDGGGRLKPGAGRTALFLHPPAEFRVVGGLLTNFHLPRSTLLMLVSAFASPGREEGREQVLSAYQEAVRERYRFFSYGDAMLLV